MDFSVSYTFSADMNRFTNSLTQANAGVTKLDIKMKKLDSNMTKVSRARPLKGLSSTQLNAIGQGFTNLGNIIGNVVKKMVLLTTAASGAILKIAKTGMTFEKNFADVAKVLDDGTASMNSRLAQLREELMNLSKTLPVPTKDLLKLSEIGGQMGIAVEHIKPFAEWMSKLTVATNITANAGSELVAKFFNNMNLVPNTKNLQEFANVITALGNNMAGQEDGILKIAQLISQQANLLKISVKDTLALASSFNALNVRPEVARTFFQKTTDAIDEMVAHGGAELSKFTKMMGTTNAKFKSIWSNDPFQGYVAVIRRFSKMTNVEMTDTYKTFFNSNIRNLATIKQVAGAFKQLELAQEIANKATGNTIAINNELARRFDTVASKLLLIRNNWEAVSTHVYQIFEPTIKKSLDKTINLLDRFDKAILLNKENIQRWIKSFGSGFFESTKIFGQGIDYLIKSLKKWMFAQQETKRVGIDVIFDDVAKSIGKIVGLIPTMFLASKALKGIGGAFKLIGGMVTVLGGGPTAIIIGLATAIGLAFVNSEELRQKFGDLSELLTGFVEEHEEDIKNFFEEIAKTMKENQPLIEKLSSTLENLVKNILPVFGFLGNMIAAGWELFKGVLIGLTPYLHELLDIFNWLIEVIGGVFGWINRLIAVFDETGDKTQKLKNLIKDTWNGIKVYTWKAIQGIISKFLKIPDKFKEAFDALPAIVSVALRSVPGIIADFIGNIPGAVISALLGGGKKPAKMSIDGVTEVIHSVRTEPFNPGVFTDFGGDSRDTYNFNVYTKTATNASDLAKIKQKKGLVTA